MIVWLASYPRSGNTFLRVILNKVFNQSTYSIYNDKTDIANDVKTKTVVGHKLLPVDFCLHEARNSSQVYLIKTHGLPSNKIEDDRVIYLVRDGRESSKSYLNYLNDYYHSNVDLDDIIAGDVMFGAWGRHVESWSSFRKTGMLIVSFEDLVVDTSATIAQLAHFLELAPISSDIPTFDELHKINPKFFKSGKLNSWEEFFSKEQSLYFNIKNNNELINFNYEIKNLSKKENYEFSGLVSHIESHFQNKLKEKSQQLEEKSKQLEEKDKQLDEKSKQLDEKDKQLDEKDKQLEEKDKQLDEKSQQLDEKSKQLEEKDKQLDEKSQQLEEKNKQLEEKDKQLEEKNKQLDEKDKQLDEKSQQLDEKDKQLDEKDKQLDEKSQQLEEKDKQLDEKDKQLDEKSQQLDEKDKQLDEKSQQLEEKDKQLDEKDKQLEEKNKQLDEKDKQLDEKDKQLEEKDKQLEEKNKELLEIYGSKRWRLVCIIGKIWH